MKRLSEFLFVVLTIAIWNAGIVVANGFWSTFAAICIPPYAWYLLVEHVMTING